MLALHSPQGFSRPSRCTTCTASGSAALLYSLILSGIVMPQFLALNVLKSRQVTPGGIFLYEKTLAFGERFVVKFASLVIGPRASCYELRASRITDASRDSRYAFFAFLFFTKRYAPKATSRIAASKLTLRQAWNGLLRYSMRTSDLPFGISTARRSPNAL